jgi:hypothetical protein
MCDRYQGTGRTALESCRDACASLATPFAAASAAASDHRPEPRSSEPLRYTATTRRQAVSIHDKNHPLLPGATLEEPRDSILASAPPFPPYEELVLDGLTDDEETSFLTAIVGA